MERTLDSHIRNLRQKLEPDPANPIYVQTVYGVGFRLAEELTGVLLLPNRAIQADRATGTYSVNLVTTGPDGAETIETVPVTIGLRDNRYTQITGGLAEGDVVQIGDALPVQSFGPPTVESSSE